MANTLQVTANVTKLEYNVHVPLRFLIPLLLPNTTINLKPSRIPESTTSISIHCVSTIVSHFTPKMADKSHSASADTGLPAYTFSSASPYNDPNVVRLADAKEPRIDELQDPKLLRKLKCYRIALFTTWSIILAFFIWSASYAFYVHHTHSSDANNYSGSNTTIDNVTGTMHTRDDPYIRYRCIAGFTSEQMDAGLDWMEKQYDFPDRIWPGQECSTIPIVAKDAAILEEWNFQADR